MLLHADDFTIYGNASYMLNGVYAEANCVLTLDPDGFSSGKVLNQNPPGTIDNASIPFRYVLQYGAVQKLGSAFRLWLSELPTTDGMKWRYELCDVSNNYVARFYITANGRLAVQLDGGAEYVTPVPVVTANGWYHIEWKHEITGATASFEVRIEGVTVLQETDVACTAHNLGMVRTYSDNISRNYAASMKDFVLWDETGVQNVDFLGAVLVTNVAPIADVSLNWTPNVGDAGFSILDNVPPDNSQYIAATLDQIGTPYVADLSDLPLNTTSVKGVITYVRAAKTDGGDGRLQTALISDGVTELGADRPITVAQTYWRDIFEHDPATNQPWTPAAVNSANLQINRTV